MGEFKRARFEKKDYPEGDPDCLTKYGQEKERRMTMKRSPVPENADALLTLGEGIATVLHEKREELGSTFDTEALLRAAIAGATFSIHAYLVMLSGAGKSPVA